MDWKGIASARWQNDHAKPGGRVSQFIAGSFRLARFVGQTIRKCWQGSRNEHLLSGLPTRTADKRINRRQEKVGSPHIEGNLHLFIKLLKKKLNWNFINCLRLGKWRPCWVLWIVNKLTSSSKWLSADTAMWRNDSIGSNTCYRRPTRGRKVPSLTWPRFVNGWQRRRNWSARKNLLVSALKVLRANFNKSRWYLNILHLKFSISNNWFF